MAYHPKRDNTLIHINFAEEVVEIIRTARAPLTRDQVADKIRQRTGKCYSYAAMRLKMSDMVYHRLVYQLYKGVKNIVYWKHPSHPDYMTDAELTQRQKELAEAKTRNDTGKPT